MKTHPDLLQMAADDAVARGCKCEVFFKAAGDCWDKAKKRQAMNDLAFLGEDAALNPDWDNHPISGGYGAMSIRKGQAADITTYKEAVAMFQRGATILDVVRRFGIPLNRARRWRREAGMGPSKGARRG